MAQRRDNRGRFVGSGRSSSGGPGGTRQVSVVVAALTRFIEGLMTRLALEFHTQMVTKPPTGTPVDTSWARANWIPRIGQAYSGTAGTPNAVSQAAQQAGIADVVTRYKLPRGAIFVSNGVPYIARLNNGWSKQSPAGFVQAGVAKAVAIVAGAA